MRKITLFFIFFPFVLFNQEQKIEVKPHIEYHEHIRLRLNRILDIPEGKNYWDREFQTKPYEDKLKKYLQENY